MNITVFLAAGIGNKKEYIDATEKLGRFIGLEGHTLVYGGSDCGLMKVLCDSAMTNGANVIGVEPDIEFIRKKVNPKLTNVIYTDSMADRKAKMMELGDVFIALPGGLGTFDEIFEVLEMIKLEKCSGKVVFYNVEGYYDPIENLLNNTLEANFVDKKNIDNILVSGDLNEIISFIK